MNKLLKFVEKNPGILEQAASFTDLAKQAVSSPPPAAPIVLPQSSSQGFFSSTPSTPVIPVKPLTPQELLDNQIKGYNNIKYILISILVAWGIAMVFSRLWIEDEEKKKNFEVIHNSLFGSIGIVPLIVLIWLIGLIITTVIVDLNVLLPKAGKAMDAFSTVMSGSMSKIPDILLKSMK